jgi:hypothetical protein
MKGDQDADFCLLTIDNTHQIPDVCGVHFAGLNGEDDLLSFPLRLVMEIQAPVNPFVSTLLLFDRSGTDEAERPPLKLIGLTPFASASASGSAVGSPMTFRVGASWKLSLKRFFMTTTIAA